MADRADFLALARKRFLQGEEADNPQRRREIEDLKCASGDWWPADQRASRGGQPANSGLPSIPARPCLTVDMTRDPIRHVLAEEQQADLGIEITPADDFAGLTQPIDDTEIELREGLVRRIQRESQARDARAWAFDRAVKCGRGYYGVMTRFAAGKTNNQDIYVERFYNQSTVLLDPAHEHVDGSDAEWGFYGTDMPWDHYKAEHPDRDSYRKDQTDDDEWRACGDEAPDWFHTDGDTRSVRVMNYFYKERRHRELLELADGQLFYADELAQIPDKAQIVSRRPDVDVTVKWAKIDGAQVLDETDWPGKWIPIVKVIGEEIQPFDKERLAQGMIRPARWAQHGFNVTLSTEVEVALQQPRRPVVGYAGQFEGFEDAWDQWQVRPITRLEVNAKTEQVPQGGLPIPSALQLDTAAPVQMWDGLRQVFGQSIKSTTGIPDPTLGNVDPSLRSGRAIRELVENAKRGTSGYMNNLVKSVTHEARILNDLLYPIYGTKPGRLVQMMTGKHESRPVLVGQHFTKDQKGRPVPVPQGQQPPEGAEQYRLTPDANFNVAIRVGKDFDTRRQEESSTIGELIQADPQLLTWFGDLFFENQDGPGHKDLADRAKLMLAPPIQASLAGQKPQDPQVQALQAENAQLKQLLQTEQAKQAGMLQKAKIDQETALMKTAKDADTRVRVAGIGAEASVAVADIKAQNDDLDRRLLMLEMLITAQKEARLEQEQRSHEHAQGTIDRAHDVGLAAMEHAHAKELAEHQAELEPEPTDNGHGE